MILTLCIIGVLLVLVVSIVAIITYKRQQKTCKRQKNTYKQKKPQRIMSEGKLLKSEMVFQGGEQFYVEKVAFKDWHVSIHSFYLISDRLAEGHIIVEQRWDYNDFCNITVRLEDYTYLLIRQVDTIALVRSFRPIPIAEFDTIAQSLIA